MGCIRTYIDSLTINSIREKGNTAQVYYRMTGTTNNGSAFENGFDLSPQKAGLRADPVRALEVSGRFVKCFGYEIRLDLNGTGRDLSFDHLLQHIHIHI